MAKKRPKAKASKQPKVAKQTSITDTINNEVIAEALSSVNQPLLLKVCRLCESKDGPFLNIFDPDQVTAKKIEELMPFGIAENDDLPHKICFRCSAKVEELYEFIQKCINTQESLQKALGRKDPLIPKVKIRKIWEEKLIKSNMSNDDICDALIKKAMEGIKDIPLKSQPLVEETPPPSTKKGKNNLESVAIPNTKNEDNESDEIPIKQLKLSIDKCDKKSPASRPSRSNNRETLLSVVDTTVTRRSMSKKESFIKNSEISQEAVIVSKVCKDSQENQPTKSINQFSNDYGCSDDESDKVDLKLKETVKLKEANLEKDQKVHEKVEPTVQEAPFKIMDHVSKIKVNGVGVLFQCKLCNRNFLKKEVVESHDCTKKGRPKIDFTKHLPPPEPPKISTVRYIKIDDDFRKSLNSKPDMEVKKSSSQDNINIANAHLDINKTSDPESKPKPKVGPASKVKRVVNNLSSSIGLTVRAREPTPPPAKPPQEPVVPNSNPLTPSVHFPSIPSLNSRYKLVPGPNNTFTLVEENVAVENKAEPEVKVTQPKSLRKRKSDDNKIVEVPVESKETVETSNKSKASKKKAIPEVINLDENPKDLESIANQQPYPVGLFQTMPHHSSIYVPSVTTAQAVFTTPAMKKQSYTIVQTGNPSKLLISTKPQQPSTEEAPKKRQRKSKVEVKEDFELQQPFSVTLEDSSPPKDAGFFNFINVDPLLQPSYVLPTDNIIQESQISTSTPAERNAAAEKEKERDKEKYSCNMCGEKFSREKKLLAHIQSHYTKMDEEDQLREKATNKKRGRK